VNEAIHQKNNDKNRFVREARIFSSCFLWKRDIISGIQSNATGIIRKYNKKRIYFFLS
jgi:hypothetical protein